MIYCEDCSSYECGCPERKEIESLRQQLAAALAAIKSKDAALQSAISAHRYESGDLHDALAIQPDDSALQAFAEKVREQCAQVCESIDSLSSSNPPMACANAIRNLKELPK